MSDSKLNDIESQSNTNARSETHSKKLDLRLLWRGMPRDVKWMMALVGVSMMYLGYSVAPQPSVANDSARSAAQTYQTATLNPAEVTGPVSDTLCAGAMPPDALTYVSVDCVVVADGRQNEVLHPSQGMWVVAQRNSPLLVSSAAFPSGHPAPGHTRFTQLDLEDIAAKSLTSAQQSLAETLNLGERVQRLWLTSSTGAEWQWISTFNNFQDARGEIVCLSGECFPVLRAQCPVYDLSPAQQELLCG